ncbi:MAG: hypothetical protein HUU20_27130 [Pirellulales bacterium]|nr:hypothetical protein [Pirellulales bacterium]
MTEPSGVFTILDWAVLVGYFFGITAFGLWISRKIRSSGGYFLGDRQLPWWVMVGQSFGTGTNAENPVAQTGASFHAGFATIWYQWKNMLITHVPHPLAEVDLDKMRGVVACLAN